MIARESPSLYIGMESLQYRLMSTGTTTWLLVGAALVGLSACKSDPASTGASSSSAHAAGAAKEPGSVVKAAATAPGSGAALPDGFLLPLPAGSKLIAVKASGGRHQVTAWLPGTMVAAQKHILAESKSLGLWATRVEDVGAEGEVVIRAWPRRPLNPSKAKRATIDVRLSAQRKGVRARIDASDVAPAAAEDVEETGSAEARCEAYCKKEISCNPDKANILDCDMECTPQGTLRAMTAVWDCTKEACATFNACTEKALAESLGIDEAKPDD